MPNSLEPTHRTATCFDPDPGDVGIHIQSFPHSNTGYSKLMTEAEYIGWFAGGGRPAPDPQSDGVCTKCHIWRDDSSEASGRTY